ncbi:ABC transporter permease [Chryseosolibacter indicus]|uniref:Transport permease protein n=1 Tax=Chryseosolibacter indicus TaxID=2782351 RepID=A0ABS5VTY7_9BACT|nr:ABC transporter permease [Chryseosolibacter indicus]MBT1704889.1 ABC transporter permease [Chryseosolibacter indicus]
MTHKEFDILIEPGRSEKNYWRDLWRYKELFYILSWRDIKIRYKQTVIGAAWSVIRPLLTMIVFTIIFSRVAKLPTEGTAPYAIMVFAGLLPWQFFSTSLSEASNSLIGNTNLITKVYFPRLIIPASSVITSFVDFAISFGLLLVMMVGYQFAPSLQIIFLPLFIIIAFASSFGISLFLTALNVKYRDFKYIIPFIVQFGLYISPVGFSSNVVPEKWKLLYAVNPMVGIIDGFRWSIIGETSFPALTLSISIIVTSLFLFLGVGYFRKTEKSFADNI